MTDGERIGGEVKGTEKGVRHSDAPRIVTVVQEHAPGALPGASMDVSGKQESSKDLARATTGDTV